MNYYNEFNPEAAAWLRQLIAANLIPAGIVDERSIVDVQASDLAEFTQCHFFAGIGGWPLALQLAGVGCDSQLWTGSCPCQPFSSAGQGKGAKDDRHLWPAFARLIAQCRPSIVLGEQVDSAIGHGWLDGVSTDMEAQDYAIGSAVLPACGIGSPHRRYRLFWAGVLADANSQQRDGCRQLPGRHSKSANDGSFCSMANADSANKQQRKKNQWCDEFSGRSQVLSVGDGDQQRRDGINALLWPERQEDTEIAGDGRVAVYCSDGKHRQVPTQSLFHRVADGFSVDLDRMRDPRNGYPLTEKGQVPHRRALLHGYGNAIHPGIAAAFVRAVMS